MKHTDYAPMKAPPNPHATAAHKALTDYGLQLLHNPPPLPLYPLDTPRVVWLTFADETGCGLWCDDPATIL